MVFGRPIPGATPLDDVSGLKVKGVAHRHQLNLLEAENIAKATYKYLQGPLSRKLAPFDYSWCIRLHEEMFGDVWEWAGTLRRIQTNIGVPPQHIEHQLYELVAFLDYWRARPWIEQAADLHSRAVNIHPFPNGNGRWSRMLANIWLHLHGQPLTMWPEHVRAEAGPVRDEYITAVQAAANGDLEPLIGLHRRFTPPGSAA